MSEFFKIETNAIIFRRRYETVRIDAWGESGLRVRTTENKYFTSEDWALSEPHSEHAEICFTDEGARITNGNISAEITEYGRIRFLNSRGEVLLSELYRTMVYGKGFGG